MQLKSPQTQFLKKPLKTQNNIKKPAKIQKKTLLIFLDEAL
jgi:hypothetical protein